MELSVSYNGDLELIDRLGEFDSVVNIFGATSNNITGGGRNSEGLTAIDRKDIEMAVRKAHDNHIEFNYLMNSSCMGNKEYTESTYQKIIENLDWVNDIGVDWVTIANPYIVEICKKRHPNIKISLSSFSMVESVQRAKFYDDLGVDEISVRENINRDFGLLKQMQQSVKCRIQVIANQTCLYQCPYQFYHDNVMSHSSQRDTLLHSYSIDYCILNCLSKKFSCPEEIIKSRWIRPEDLSVYEAEGITKFKITDRVKSTDWLVNVVKSYHERKHEGNLADILNLVQIQNKRSSGTVVSTDVTKVTEDTKKARKMMKDFMMLDVQIDNRKLDGFLDHYKKTDCRNISCDKCGYCKRVADDVLTFTSKKRMDAALEDMEQIKDSILVK